jgi:hypothetical protein
VSIWDDSPPSTSTTHRLLFGPLVADMVDAAAVGAPAGAAHALHPGRAGLPARNRRRPAECGARRFPGRAAPGGPFALLPQNSASGHPVRRAAAGRAYRCRRRQSAHRPRAAGCLPGGQAARGCRPRAYWGDPTQPRPGGCHRDARRLHVKIRAARQLRGPFYAFGVSQAEQVGAAVAVDVGHPLAVRREGREATPAAGSGSAGVMAGGD